MFRRSRVNSFSLVENSIILDDSVIGRNCTVRNAIIDKNVTVPEGTQIGVNLEDDRTRGFTVTENGVVVVPKSYTFE